MGLTPLEVPCPACGARLRLNPNLAGATVPCPSCGAGVTVPAPQKRKQGPSPASGRSAGRASPKPAPSAPAAPFTFWLLGAQASLAVLGLTCLGGAFLDFTPPAWSYLAEPAIVLIGAGVALLAAGWFATYLPVLVTLLAAAGVMAAGAWHYGRAGEVDASRALALMTAMLALWCALQHRRAVART